jgi:hypothetical protein
MELKPVLELAIDIGTGLVRDLGHDEPTLPGPHEEPGRRRRQLASPRIGGHPFI